MQWQFYSFLFCKVITKGGWTTHEIFTGLFSLAISKLHTQEYFLMLRKHNCPSSIQSLCQEDNNSFLVPNCSSSTGAEVRKKIQTLKIYKEFILLFSLKLFGCSFAVQDVVNIKRNSKQIIHPGLYIFQEVMFRKAAVHMQTQ